LPAKVLRAVVRYSVRIAHQGVSPYTFDGSIHPPPL